MNDNKDNNYTLDIAYTCKGIRYTCLVLCQQNIQRETILTKTYD